MKRAVRQRCGFGCVICGVGFIEYDHFDPEFADAQEHNPDGIVLLCPHHHALKTKNPAWLPLDDLRAASKQPHAVRAGYSEWQYPSGRQPPTVSFGEVTCKNVGTVFEVNGQSILSIRPPSEPGGKYLLSAFLVNADATEMIEIIDNEARTSTENWDMTIEGATIKVWTACRSVALVMRITENQDLTIDELEMTYRGVEISIKRGQPTSIYYWGAPFSIMGGTVEDAKVGLKVDSTGAALGVGGGKVTVGELNFGKAVGDGRKTATHPLFGMPEPVLAWVNALPMNGFPIRLGGSVARLICAFPANDDTFAPLL
ncbi:MAG: HNH endonuclease signature motif containing protein [Burkholderiaceae bacterium]